MKKLILAVVMMFVVEGVAFSDFFELNVKAGPAFPVSISSKEDQVKTEKSGKKIPGKGEDGKSAGSLSFDASLEGLFTVNDSIKVGVGGGYLLPVKVEKAGSITFSHLPVYATIRINPISSAKGLFFKADAGYAIFFNSLGNGLPSQTEDAYKDEEEDDKAKKAIKDDTIKDLKNNGGLYFGAGIGYELSNGIAIDLMYKYYNSSCSFRDSDTEYKWKNGTSTISLNVGLGSKFFMKLFE